MNGSRGGSSFVERLLLSPVTWLITALNVGIFVLCWLSADQKAESVGPETLLSFGASMRYFVQGGEYWRLLTAVFLHGGWIHLLLNTWVMFGWCAAIERTVGSLWFAFAYLTTGIASFAVSVIFREGPSVGASGAAFGMIAVALALLYRRAGNWEAFLSTPSVKQVLINAGLWILIGFTMLRGIDNWAHLGGFAFGVPCGLVLEARRGRRRPVWIASLVAYMVVWAGVVVAACTPGVGLNR
jgi:rhomboid protease GluP